MAESAKENWGRLSSGQEVHRYRFTKGRLSVSLIDYGAAVQRITFNGLDMVVSLPEPALYEKFRIACIGAVVGRYAGRIAGGRVRIDGRQIMLSQNQGKNHLHGGFSGFSTRMWQGEIINDDNSPGVNFSLLSPDGDEGYPGKLRVSVTYSITDDDGLSVEYEAASDKDTIINLTNHCYFTPNGYLPIGADSSGQSISDNSDVELMIASDRIVELDGDIPTGRLIPVEGTEFDFRGGKRLSGWFDNSFVLCPHDFSQAVASAAGMRSGVLVECFTDQPGAQLFTMGNPGTSFAFETQHFPDSPHHPDFPSTLLRADEVFRSRTIYRFSCR